MTIRWVSLMGSLAAAADEILIAEGATADDLPEGDAGLYEIGDRVRQHDGAMYAASDAQWIELHAWEQDPTGFPLREQHIERGMGAPEVQPPAKDTP